MRFATIFALVLKVLLKLYEAKKMIAMEDRKSWTKIFKIKGDPDKQSKAFKENYPKFTNDDLLYEAGDETGLFI